MSSNDPSSNERLDQPKPFERTAAELTAALALPHEAVGRIPAATAARIIASGQLQLRIGTSRLASVVAPTGAPIVAPTAAPVAATRSRWAPRAGWMLAAAAMLAWVLVPSPIARGRTASALTTVALFDSLVAGTSAIRVPWAPSTDPAGATATGEVVWDARTQRGVLRIAGLAPNDPRIAQYQLWIIDASRDARYPVDGGVFDVTKDGEVLIPIMARLRVQDPTVFAVTLERPGGVVVSSRERLVLAAQVKG